MNKYLEKLNRKNAKISVEELEEFAKENKVPIIEYESLMVLKTLIKTANVKKILEIGTAIAYSSINMASFDDEIKIDTIERNEVMYKEALKNVKAYNLEKQITIHFDDALLIDLEKLDSNYDLIFIDAAKAQSEKFFNRFLPLLKETGIIVTDNLLFHGCVENQEGLSKNVKNLVRKIDEYNNYLTSLKGFTTTFLATGDGLAITMRGK